MPYFKLGMDKNVIVPYQDYLAAMKPDFDYVGDKAEIKDLVRCLFLPNANSVKIVAKRGCGITALMDGLVQHQNADFMPHDIMIRPIYKLNASNLFNTSDTKAIETRFRASLDKLRKVAVQRRVKPILVLDDGYGFVSNAGQHVINALIEADVTANYIDMIVGVDEKHQKDFNAKHPEIPKSFTVKVLDEPKDEDLFEIVRHHANKHQAFGVAILDSTVRHIIDITQRFKGMYETAQPDRAIRLLDSAATAFRLEIHSQPPGAFENAEKLAELQTQLSILKEQSNKAIEIENLNQAISSLSEQMKQDASDWENHRNKISEFQEDIRKFDRMIAEKQIEIEKLDEETLETNYTMLKKHLEELEQGDESFKGRPKQEVLSLDRQSLLDFAEFDMNISRNPLVSGLESQITHYTESMEQLQQRLTELAGEMQVESELRDSFVEEIASAQTKTPVGGITGRVNRNIRNGVALMKESVFGQDEVIEAIIGSLRRSASGMGDPNRPLGVFMIAGPPGNGKTYTGRQLAEKIFGSEDFCRVVPMGSYREKHAVSKLISAPPGYAGYEDKALFAEIGQQMPFGVMILDEVEKAHPDIRQAMLEILSTGQFEALNGDKADFRNIIILSTSNYAQDVWLDNDFETARALFMERIRSDVTTFSPEYLDRHDALLCTGPLDETALTNILKKEVRSMRKASARKHPDLHIEVSEEDISLFAREHCIGNSGRSSERKIREAIGGPLSDIKLEDANASGVVSYRYDQVKKAFVFEYQRGQQLTTETTGLSV